MTSHLRTQSHQRGQDIRLSDLKGGVRFDLNNDGNAERTAWTLAGTPVAFLAIDLNGNGQIDGARELFGSNTLPGVRNGFKALNEMNKALKPAGAPEVAYIDASQPLYEKLLLWTDSNHNRFSDEGEIQPASEVVTSIVSD